MSDSKFEMLLADSDWAEVFGEGSGGNCTPIIPDPAPIGSSVSLATFSRADVAEIYGMEDGENDGDDWIIYGKLKDGRYFAARGGCDYTGWDCQASNSGNVALAKEDLIAFGLGDSERERFRVGIQQMKDERLNLPSASSIDRYFHCNGSFLLERQVPEKERLSSRDAERGTLLHEARERGDVSGLKLSDADVVLAMAEAEQRIFTNWTDEFGIRDAEIVQENRLWLMNGRKKVCSGKCDFYAISQSKKMALVLDRKSGRKEVPPPPSNWQLRTQAVILMANYNLVHCRVGIIQPLRKTQPLCDYTVTELFEAWNQLTALLEKINSPDAKRVAGQHCEFCNARHLCPESKGVVERLFNLKGLAWATLSAESKLELFKLCKQAEPIIKAIKENIAAEMAADANAIPGLIKKPDQTPREVVDLKGVQEVLLAKFPAMRPEQFLALCKMSLEKLKEFYRQTTGASDKEADIFVNQDLAPFVVKSKTKRGAVELAK